MKTRKGYKPPEIAASFRHGQMLAPAPFKETAHADEFETFLARRQVFEGLLRRHGARKEDGMSGPEDAAKIWFIGDVHGLFAPVTAMVRQAADKPLAVVFLGDLECQRPFHEEVADIEAAGVPVWFVPGNHDSDNEDCYRNLFESDLAERNLHGRVAALGGLRIAGLGGVFRGEIWYPPDGDIRYENYEAYLAAQARKQPLRLRDSVPAQGKARKHRTSIFYQDWLELQGARADILVSHEAPSCHPHGFAAIDELARALGAARAFHGHQHDCLDYRPATARLGFQAFGVGLGGITNGTGRRILPGRLDEIREHRRGG